MIKYDYMKSCFDAKIRNYSISKSLFPIKITVDKKLSYFLGSISKQTKRNKKENKRKNIIIN